MIEDGRINIPEPLAERFAAAYSGFITEIKLALADAGNSEDRVVQAQAGSWREILPVLEGSQVGIDAALSAFRKGEAKALVDQAEDMRGLSKHLDGFARDFAGPEHEVKLIEFIRSVAIDAYRICEIAGIP